ncbi:MAG TPA: hypothetical protein DCP36_01805, partial [Sporomusaceae bacterium]|nr:hypothetical protein [Sporomusaceae bacterium]
TVVSKAVGSDGQSGATITTSAAENNTTPHVWIANEIKNILTGTLIDYGASWITGEDFDLMQSILVNSSYNDVVQVVAKLKSGDYIGALEHTVALGSSVGFGKNVEKLNEFSEKIRKYKGSSNAIDFTFDPKKIGKQMNKRGWTEDSIKDTLNDPVKTVKTQDTRWLPGAEKPLNDPATAYYAKDGSYVVRNDKTGEITQISNKNDPNWIAPWDTK